MPLRKHHPFSPRQHWRNVTTASSKLPTHQMPTATTAVVADVVLVEIRRAGHHDQRGWRLLRIRTTGGPDQGLHRPTGPVLKTLQLARPTSGNAGQHAQTQQRGRQSLAIPADPETPLPPSAAEQQRDGGQQRRDVAVAFVRAEAREQPGSQEIHRQPTPAPTVIPIRL